VTDKVYFFASCCGNRPLLASFPLIYLRNFVCDFDNCSPCLTNGVVTMVSLCAICHVLSFWVSR
jgi:hypothetical protein